MKSQPTATRQYRKDIATLQRPTQRHFEDKIKSGDSVSSYRAGAMRTSFFKYNEEAINAANDEQARLRAKRIICACGNYKKPHYATCFYCKFKKTT